MRSSLLSTMRRRSTIVVASAGLVTVCATSAVAAALPEDHASAKPAATVVAAHAAQPAAAVPAQAPQTVQVQPAAQQQAAQPQPAKPAAQPQQAAQPQHTQQAPAQQAQPAQQTAQQTASRSDQRTVLAATTDTSPSAVQALARTIVPADQFAAFNSIVSHESSWNINATNASSGAYGLGQALPASKMASVGADWRTSPQTQIKWALDYMNSRYGSPNAAWAFWQTHHWY